MRSIVLACLTIAALSLPVPALPHHSVANFDMKKTDTVTGTVTYFSFTNPHSFFDMEVKDKSGAVHPYKVFTMASVVLKRTGWVTGDVKVGDKVTLTGNPDRKTPTYLYLRTIVFASGKTWNHDKVVQ
jgi:hypothetical protein